MATFVYETAGFTPWSKMNLTDWLNDYGKDGWQLVSLRVIEPTPQFNEITYNAVFMKRSGD